MDYHRISHFLSPARLPRVLLFTLLFLILCPVTLALAVDIVDEDTFYTALHTAGVHELKADVVASVRPMADYQLLGVGNCTIRMNGQTITTNQIITIQGNTFLTFQGAGTLVKSTSAANSRLFYCNQATASASLTIDGPTLDSVNGNVSQTVYLSGATTTFNLISGTIQNSNTTSSDGGAIFATNNATIHMNGGLITGCGGRNGGAIYATNNATVNMSGGTITRCRGQNGGAIFTTSGASFNMSGGTIADNSAVSLGGGVVVNRGTVNLSGSALITLNIAGDNSGGLHITNNSICRMTGGTISSNAARVSSSSNGGGGISAYNGASLIMSDGVITENTSDGEGGGVCVYGSSASAVFSGSAVISSNTAGSGGGGIYASSADMTTRTSITIEGNAQIINNVSGGDGGGLYLPMHSDGIMNGGTMTGNQANLASATINAGGGGVYVGGMFYPMAYSSFVLNGGALYHNTSNSSGNDLIGAAGAQITLIPATSMGLPPTTVNGWYWDQYGSRFADTSTPTQYTPVANDHLLDIMAAYSLAKPVVVTEAPKTGDTTHVLLYLWLAAVSLIGILMITKFARRKNT